MTTERWDDDRLDRLANMVDSNARAIQALGNRVDSIAIATENNNRLIESNARVIQSLANVAAEAREERQQILQVIAQHQEEIRGLQTENRRILDILLNQRDRGDNPTA
jgi:methyl-accepting chemotaxis protein